MQQLTGSSSCPDHSITLQNLNPQWSRHLSRWILRLLDRCGCPSIDRKVVNYGKLLHTDVGLDEGEIKSESRQSDTPTAKHERRGEYQQYSPCSMAYVRTMYLERLFLP